VRCGALRAIAALAGCVQSETEAGAVAALVQPMLAAGRAAVAAADDDCAQLLFSVLDDLVESPAPLLRGQLPSVLELCVGVATEARVAAATRASALSLVAWVCNFKPKMLLKHKLVEPLLRALCPLCADVGIGGDEDDGDDDAEAQRAIHGLACQALDTLSTKLPAKHVMPFVIAYASANLNSPDDAARRSALCTLAFAVEGIGATLRPQSAALAPFIAAALRDAVPDVRTTAAFALGQLAEHCAPDVLDAHEAVLPALLAGLSDPCMPAVERVLYALDTWMECMEPEDMALYLPRFLEHLLALLDNPHAPPQLKEMALSATASAAGAAGQVFHPFLPALLPRLHACLGLTHDAGLKLRARALECLAMLVSAPGGRDAFAPLLAEAMVSAAAGFELDFSELREYGHSFYASAASAAGADFAPYLPGVAQQALASLALDDGVSFDNDSDESGDEEGDEADADDSGRMRNFSVRTGVLDEKASATRALGQYALHCGAAFTPHLEATLPVLLRMCLYFHEQVRAQAFEALGRCVAGAHAAGTPLSQAAVDEILGALVSGAQEDDDKAAAAMAMEAAAVVLRTVGRAATAEHLSSLAAAALAVLTRRAVCQAGADGDASDDDGSEDEADAEDAEELLMSAVSELLPALASVTEPAVFLPRFSEHFRALMSRGRASAPDGERAEVSAILVQVAVALGPAVAPCGPVAMPFVLREMACSDSGNRRNSVFLGGVLMQAGGDAMAPHLPALLAALYPLLGAGEPDAAVHDNAAAAATRLLLARVPGLPEHEVLLALLAALPLQEDMEEAMTVYGGLCALLRRGDAALLPFVPRIVQVFGEFAATPPSPPPSPDGMKAAASQAAAVREVGATLAAMLASPLEAQLRQLLSALPPAHAQALAAAAAGGM
jgi:hypothetical protein